MIFAHIKPAPQGKRLGLISRFLSIVQFLGSCLSTATTAQNPIFNKIESTSVSPSVYISSGQPLITSDHFLISHYLGSDYFN